MSKMTWIKHQYRLVLSLHRSLLFSFSGPFLPLRCFQKLRLERPWHMALETHNRIDPIYGLTLFTNSTLMCFPQISTWIAG